MHSISHEIVSFFILVFCLCHNTTNDDDAILRIVPQHCSPPSHCGTSHGDSPRGRSTDGHGQCYGGRRWYPCRGRVECCGCCGSFLVYGIAQSHVVARWTKAGGWKWCRSGGWWIWNGFGLMENRHTGVCFMLCVCSKTRTTGGGLLRLCAYFCCGSDDVCCHNIFAF